MDLIKNFGISWILLAAQIVNFLIILYLLKRFAYKPILEVLEKRRKTIEEAHKNAENAAKAMEKALEEEKRILQKAQNEAKSMLAEATKQAETILEQANGKAKAQSERLIKETQEQMELDRKEMERQLATKTTDLALTMLQQSLKGFFDDKQQKEVLERAGKVLKK